MINDKLQIKKTLTGLAAVVIFLTSATSVFAHAVVKPNTAGVGAFTDFTLGVPSEKAVATTAVKLMIPAGLNNVSPIVKPGWQISVKQSPDPSGKKDDDGNRAMITSEIDWTGGQIPGEQKDLFMFSAQVPSQPGELDWKVEQTYADGSIVSWTLGSNETKDKTGQTEFGPYSKTMVINDLATASTTPAMIPAQTSSTSNSKTAMMFGVLGTILGGVALAMQLRKK